MAVSSRLVILNIVLRTCIVLSIVHNNNNNNNNKPVHDNTTYEGSKNGSLPANAKQIRWANGAFNYIHNVDCSEVYFTTARECQKMLKLRKEQVNIYIADPSAYGRLRTVIPDDDLDHRDIHDVVLVLDPYPEANLGHLVVIFFIDLYLPKDQCEKASGLSLGEFLMISFGCNILSNRV